MVNLAIEAAKALADEGISAEVINIHTISLLIKKRSFAPQQRQAQLLPQRSTVLSAVSEVQSQRLFCESGKPVPVVRLGVNDAFRQIVPLLSFFHIYGLDAQNICCKAPSRQ